MSKKRRRSLSPEENDLWNKVARQATPLHASPQKATLPEVFEPAPAEPKTIPIFEIGEKRTATVDRAPIAPKTQPITMDKKAYAQLRRGKRKPEARLDLHGMTLAEAGPRLSQFISRAYADGLRLVLIITGKGKDRDDGGPIPLPRGVLRRQVPQWLSSASMSPMVMEVAEAHLKHGGSGAFYVYLRRRK